MAKRAKKDVEQAGQQAVPEGGAAVPADPVVPAPEPADAVSGNQGEPQAAGAGNDPAADPVAAVEGAAVDMGTQEAAPIAGRWRKKAVVIDAIQYRYPFMDQIAEFAGEQFPVSLGDETELGRELIIHTLEDGSHGQAKHVASNGDWVIRGVKGEIYPCKPDIFGATYERAVDPVESPAAGGNDEAELTDPVVKARRAAADAYVNVAHEVGALEQLDGDEHEGAEFVEAAAYLLANPDADPASIPIHLFLKKLGGTMTPSDRQVMLCGVFADTFRRVHGFLVDQAAAEEAAKAAAAPAQTSGREQAFKVEDPAFTPSGFSARD